MRSRPRLHLRAPRARAGAELRATLVVDAGRAVPIESIRAVLHGQERMWGSQGERRDVGELYAEVSVRRVIPPGRHLFGLTFALPADAPPSYHGRHFGVEYRIAARVEVPWWPDAHGEWPIQLDPALPAARGHASAGVPAVDMVRGAPAFEVTIDQPIAAPGGVLRGSLHTRGPAAGFDLLLVAVEQLSYVGAAPVEVERHAFPTIKPLRGVPTRFELAVPRHAPRTLNARLGRLSWFLHAMGHRVSSSFTLRIPFEVTAPRGEPRVHAAAMIAHSPVTEALWQPVGAAFGLAYASGRMSGEHAGAQVSLWREPRGRRPVLVGELAFPSLRLDLCVEPRRVLQVRPNGLHLVHGDDPAYFIDAREEAQHSALLIRLAAPLAALPQASLSDDRFRFEQHEGWRNSFDLQSFVRSLCWLARALAEARQELPLPAGAPRLEHWQALAGALDGRLERGDLSISGTLGATPAEVLPSWRDRTVTLRVAPPFALAARWRTAPLDPASLPPEAQAALARACAGEAVAVAATAEQLTLTGAAMPADPRQLLPRLQALTDLAGELRFGAGPYR